MAVAHRGRARDRRRRRHDLRLCAFEPDPARNTRRDAWAGFGGEFRFHLGLERTGRLRSRLDGADIWAGAGGDDWRRRGDWRLGVVDEAVAGVGKGRWL